MRAEFPLASSGTMHVGVGRLLTKCDDVVKFCCARWACGLVKAKLLLAFSVSIGGGLRLPTG